MERLTIKVKDGIDTDKMGIYSCLKKLSQLEDLEEKIGIGLVELFELVGKEVYSLRANSMAKGWLIRTSKVQRIIFDDDMRNLEIEADNTDLYIDEFNVWWFLTKEEAKMALGEMNAKN